MKRTLALTAATAALALSLAACGAERADGGMSGAGNAAGGTTATDTMRGDEAGTGTTGGASANRSTVTDGLGGVTGAVNRGRRGVTADDRDGYAIGGPNSSSYAAAYNRGVTQEEAAARSRLERMLENGRVHDSDGFLLDGENAANSTF